MAIGAWWGIAGAVVGSLLGGFSGFLANSIHYRAQARSHRLSVASALVGEIEALCKQVEIHYLAQLKQESESEGYGGPRHPHHGFRGERDYMPIFHSLGSSIGSLPRPLPRDLAYWYLGFSACLERAHELHDLTERTEPASLHYANELAAKQRTEFAQLLQEVPDLIDRLLKIR